LALPFRVVSIGEDVPEGVYYKIFSSHCKAVNFIWQNQVFSVCCRTLSQGPYRIVVDTDDVSSILSVCYENGSIKLNDQPCDTSGMVKFSVPAFVPQLTSPTRKARIEDSRRFLVRHLPPQSVGFLLRTSNPGKQTFDQALGSLYQRGLDHFESGEYALGVKCFKGRGYGFTPGGDDFLAGFMLGAAWIQHLQKKRLSEIMAILLYESLSDNCLTNTFLLQAYHLKPDQVWVDFLLALESDSGILQDLILDIASSGATSGYDTLSGFYSAWEIL